MRSRRKVSEGYWKEKLRCRWEIIKNKTLSFLYLPFFKKKSSFRREQADCYTKIFEDFEKALKLKKENNVRRLKNLQFRQRRERVEAKKIEEFISGGMSESDAEKIVLHRDEYYYELFDQLKREYGLDD